MNRTIIVFKMHFRDLLLWIYLPLIITIFNFAINLIVSLTLKNSTQIYTGGVISIYIYYSVLSIITLTQNFPFAIGLSISRKSYFLGTTAMITLVSTTIALLMCIASLIERLTHHWGENLYFFDFPYLNDGTFAQQFSVYFISLMTIYFLGFFIASVYRRYGGIGMLIFFVIVALLFGIIEIFFYQNQWWETIIHLSAFDLSLRAIPVTICCGFLSYLLLRKASV